MKYKLTASIGINNLIVPREMRVENGYIVGNAKPTDIGTSLGRVSEDSWKTMPHVALVNLPTYDERGNPITRPDSGLRIDPKAAEQFIRTYGGFMESVLIDKDGGMDFKQEIAQMAKRQELLRRLWCFKGGRSSPDYPASKLPNLETMQADLRALGLPFDLPTTVIIRAGTMPRRMNWNLIHVKAELGWRLIESNPFRIEMFSDDLEDSVHLSAYDLWAFIRYVFLRDYIGGRTGICSNPNCSAPYYLKSRKDQKFCDAGCSAFAQRQYSLKWWRGNMQGKRAKKRSKSRRKRKP